MIRVKSLWVSHDWKAGTRSTGSLHTEVAWHANLSNNGRFDSEMIRVKSLEVLKTTITTDFEKEDLEKKEG